VLGNLGPKSGLNIILIEKMVASLADDFSFNDYPNVKYLIGHLILQSELKADQLGQETEFLSQLIQARLAKTDVEEKLVLLMAQYRLLKKLFRLEVTPSDYDAIVDSSLKPSGITKRLLTVNEGERVRHGEFKHMEAIDELFEKALAFYEGVKARDGFMLRRVEEQLQATGAEKAIIITGGFHKEPFEEHFRANGYNYALITPNITELGGHEAYLAAVFQGEPFKAATRPAPINFGYSRSEARAHGANPEWAHGVLDAVLREVLTRVSRAPHEGLASFPPFRSEARAFWDQTELTTAWEVNGESEIQISGEIEAYVARVENSIAEMFGVGSAQGTIEHRIHVIDIVSEKDVGMFLDNQSYSLPADSVPHRLNVIMQILIDYRRKFYQRAESQEENPIPQKIDEILNIVDHQVLPRLLHLHDPWAQTMPSAGDWLIFQTTYFIKDPSLYEQRLRNTFYFETKYPASMAARLALNGPHLRRSFADLDMGDLRGLKPYLRQVILRLEKLFSASRDEGTLIDIERYSASLLNFLYIPFPDKLSSAKRLQAKEKRALYVDEVLKKRLLYPLTEDGFTEDRIKEVIRGALAATEDLPDDYLRYQERPLSFANIQAIVKYNFDHRSEPVSLFQVMTGDTKAAGFSFPRRHEFYHPDPERKEQSPLEEYVGYVPPPRSELRVTGTTEREVSLDQVAGQLKVVRGQLRSSLLRLEKVAYHHGWE